MDIFLGEATQADFVSARAQMALSLGWHIIIACFGVALPTMTLFAEWRGIRTGDSTYQILARRWARAMGVLFAVGAVSGTIISFEMGLLWPGFMGRFGEVVGLPFAMEGFAFFTEAIFLGIYLYAWDRFSPRLHLLSGLPLLVAGIAGAFFVVSANAWMNQPRGFNLVSGQVTQVNPWRAILNPATPAQTVHMIVAAYMVTGFVAASIYAVAWLRGRRDRYHKLGFVVSFTAAVALTPVQVGVGDWAAHVVADYQPAKLAAMEGVFTTERGVPLHLGGVAVDGEMRYAILIPHGLSLLAHWDPDAEVIGLDRYPKAEHPSVNIVHPAFQLMVAAGFGLLALGAWFALSWLRRRNPPESRWFWRAASVSGLAAVVAMEAGWVTTELGRQPWIVYGLQRTRDAVNPSPGLWVGLMVIVIVYAVLTVASIYVRRRLAQAVPLTAAAAVAPQEIAVTGYKIV